MNLTEGIFLIPEDTRFNVSKEGSMLIGWNQSICLPILIPDKSKYLNDHSEDTHPISSNTGSPSNPETR
ncbi:hypothetical protein HanOQP8_Chr08g0275901 [Helianthus annuus]|nr:hypothetical protein HanOQP8_Chr08g0275901 [Helianthus annuus]